MKTPTWVIVFLPYIFMLVGAPFFNNDGFILGLPSLAFWVLLWVILTPVCIGIYDIITHRSHKEGTVA
ncbi:hypothetical protein EPA93_46865 [Ktedonosporobacter rubrisoli]|uniref:DUF3311 domain-containing protein n=1 Tax=Ktedonosporobacter rubrisoli TaxID=2509675 RepID=A0A4P6K5E7_KTERU|nr:hypothetical protein [Ktedonosporobacter rubrisoli]QBD83090.1 hypothetical protein EPA93_46865 [Ktedonosporobacter rubrisoli]